MNKLVKTASETTDPEAEYNGVWVTYTRDGGEYRVKLARSGSTNKELVKLNEKLTRSYRRSGQDMNQLDPDVQRRISGELYANTVVRDWNAEDFGVAYSVEEGISTFQADPDFLNFCIEEAGRAASYRRERITVTSGN